MNESKTESGFDQDRNLRLAAASLRDLLEDEKIPAEVREALAADYEQVQAMLDKLEHGHLHIAVFGRVSVGKSSLANALLGSEEFSVSPLHGETRVTAMARWQDLAHQGVHLIDTPGIEEVAGEDREKLAHEVAERSDLVIFVVDGDMTDVELDALRAVRGQQRPVIVALNKSDRYTTEERQHLLESLKEHTHGLIAPNNIVAVAADPRPETVVRVDAQGNEQEESRSRQPELEGLKTRLWQVLETEGKTLAALNAGLFAGKVSDQVAERLAQTRKNLAEKVVRTYCIAKGVAVAINPIPVADLLAAAAIDVSLVVHLSRVYGLPMTRSEATRLIVTIAAQLLALMGVVWGTHVASSALKTVSAGMSVAVTAGVQGALAYYATYVVGKAAERYLVNGKSWGEGGPKRLVRDIARQLDRQSIMAEAKGEILDRLKG